MCPSRATWCRGISGLVSDDDGRLNKSVDEPEAAEGGAGELRYPCRRRACSIQPGFLYLVRETSELKSMRKGKSEVFRSFGGRGSVLQGDAPLPRLGLYDMQGFSHASNGARSRLSNPSNVMLGGTSQIASFCNCLHIAAIHSPKY